jgi:hypothetical protein
MWTKNQIRQARKIELAPLLRQLGCRLHPLQNGNLLVQNYPDLVVKQHYWTWPAKNIQGNAIDFLVLVEGKTFHQAMQILMNQRPEQDKRTVPVRSHTPDNDDHGTKTRQHCENQPEITR